LVRGDVVAKVIGAVTGLTCARAEAAEESAATAEAAVLDLGPRVGVRTGVPFDVERSVFVGPLLGAELSGTVARGMRLAAGIEVDGMPMVDGDGLQLAVAASGVLRWHPDEGALGFGLGVEGGYWFHGIDRYYPASGGPAGTRGKLLQDSPFAAPVLVPMHLELGDHRVELRVALVCSLYGGDRRTIVVEGEEQILREAVFGPRALTFALSWSPAFPLVTRAAPPR
jgi:hypothetical protein